MLFSELSNITQGKILRLEEDGDIQKFSIDSRKLAGKRSTAFVAIKGERNDGHSFLTEVLGAGIENFIIENESSLPQKGNVLLVESGVRALQAIAKFHREKHHYPVVAITGSNGKTTVKEWLWEILTKEKKVVKNPKSYNSQVGVPLSVLEMGNHDLGIFEAGISQIGEMINLAQIIQPTLGIFTNIGEAHSGGFGSQSEKIREKALLFASCTLCICRLEHTEIIEALSAKKIPVTTWSLDDHSADYFFEREGNQLSLKDQGLTFSLPFQNPNQVENALHAVTAALVLGASNESIKSAMLSLRPMRLELKKAINGCYLIDDTYNNDLFGLEVALDFLNEQNPHQTKTLILSDILQSSLPDEELNSRINGLLSSKKIDRCIYVGSKFNLGDERFRSTEELLAHLPTFENETILVKGARDFVFEKIVQGLEAKTHGTILDINFEALRRNLNQYRSKLGTSTKLMVMVKALAYGSGLSEIAGFLQNEAVDYLGVAYVDEAVELRKKGISIPIMIMNPEETDFSIFEKYNLEAEIYCQEILERFLESDAQTGIHLKLETGMNRLGFSGSDLPRLLQALQAHPGIPVKGIFTHFSSSDTSHEDAFTHEQAYAFQKMAKEISNLLGYTPRLHAVNSSGIIRFPQYHFDMVRLGIGLHGFDPTGELTLEPVSQLKTSISQIKKLRKGESVGYSRKGQVSSDSEIAILPIGYADGYLRVFGNGAGQVKIGDRLVPTIGNICMDMTMIDVTGLNAQPGDEVIVFGTSPTIQELATWAGTIPYEILTNVSERVKRVYVSE